MNNLFKKISGLALGLALTLGAGISAFTVGNGAVKADAAGSTLYDFSYDRTISTTEINAASLKGMFETALNSGNDIVTGVSSLSKVYNGYNNYSKLGLKFGTSSVAGAFTLTTSVPVNQVIIVAAGWSTGDTFNVANAGAQKPGVAYSATNSLKTLTFDFAETNSINFSITKRGFIQSIQLVEAGGDSAKVESVSVQSSTLNTTSYSSIEGWDTTGFKTNVTMSDSSTYDGNISWEVTPATPGTMIKNNKGLTVENGSLTISATAQGVTDTKIFEEIVEVELATVEEAITATLAASSNLVGVAVKGVVTSVGEYNSTYSSLTYYIADSKDSDTKIEVYSALGLEGAGFVSTNDLSVGTNVVVFGDLKKYNENVSFVYNSQILAWDQKVVDPEEGLGLENSVATFEFGDNGAATHNDGTEIKDEAAATFTDGEYTLVLENYVKTYSNAYDAKGNSALKLGTGSATGGFDFTVPSDVTGVVIYLAKYKTNSTNVKINGTDYNVATNSNDGKYYPFLIETTSTKTVSITTLVNSYRVMIDKIVYIGSTEPTPTDAIQAWIDDNLFMDDARFEGEGTGLCNTGNYYLNAKSALADLEATNEGSIAKFQANEGGKYTDALARYTAWAKACGDANPFDGNKTVVTSLNANLGIMKIADNNSYILIIVAALVAASALVAYLVINNKRKNSK